MFLGSGGGGLADYRLCGTIGQRKETLDALTEREDAVTENTEDITGQEELTVDMVIGSGGEGLLYVLTELGTHFCKVIDEFLIITIVGYVTEPLVFVK